MMLAKKCDNGNLLVEVLGTLAELTIPEYDFAAALHQQGFLDYLHRVLSPGFAEDDIVLEAVRSLGAFLEDGNCAPLLARTPLIKDLCDLVIGAFTFPLASALLMFVSPLMFIHFYVLSNHRETRGR